MQALKNNLIRQIVILLAITFLGIILIWQLWYFVPGVLGAATLYILFGSWYQKLTEEKGWKKWLAALVIILGLLILMAGPTFLLAQFAGPRINKIVENQEEIKGTIMKVAAVLRDKISFINLSERNVDAWFAKAIAKLPEILNGLAHVLTNILVALFILYFLLVSGRQVEAVAQDYLPLSRKNRKELWKETKNMVVSNAIGIPFIAFCQGLLAGLGYWVAGVPQPILWGILTGLATIIPLIGTMLIWVPACAFLIANNHIAAGLGLAAFCLVIVGFADNVIRFTFLRKFGDVHPVVTVFGVLLGMQIFGIMGLIFGPLVFSYFLLLIKIYKAEYGEEAEAAAEALAKEEAKELT